MIDANYELGKPARAWLLAAKRRRPVCISGLVAVLSCGCDAQGPASSVTPTADPSQTEPGPTTALPVATTVVAPPATNPADVASGTTSAATSTPVTTSGAEASSPDTTDEGGSTLVTNLTNVSASTDASSDVSGSGDAQSSDRAAAVCRRWNEDRADMSEGTWSGNLESCDAGDVSAPGRENALKLVNLYRFLVAMPEVEMDPVRNERAQQCALMQSANGLSHDPPMSWKCYNEVGAQASGVSSISGGRGVMSIDLYMTDGESNADTMGHRRWVFANSLGPVGFGSATSSCFYQADGTGEAKKPFVAWPPPGPVPLQALLTTKVDTAGWTIQSDSANLEDSAVSVDEAGTDLPVSQTTLPGGYGSRYALRIVPTDWTLQAGHSYHVAVSGTDIDYTIDVVDCE